ncbi:prion-like-(Q/N-rich) domain-bearing protein 25 [Cotesia glomerata]|uniref:prion-like-(Q/N-rich) domain-bearing protein 25 n=1 Tax=Cotesia glomerata TaxID=32391 RepID=UPI001D007E25|nr:prion-like-(Q/N-rich) domain-bearing protein 25 [Cotesia glomerata]
MPCSTYTDCNSLIKHSLCSENNKCECFPTYFQINETACVPYHESYCSDSDPCKLENSVCINNLCRCASHYSYIGLKCEPTFLDKPCKQHTNGDTTSCKSLLKGSCFKNSDCFVENSVCINNKCQCKIDYATDFNKRCVSKLKTTCNVDDECKTLYFQKCSIDMKNLFNSSYTFMHNFKCKLQIGDKCTLDEQCTPKHSRCIDNWCQCKPKFMSSEAGNKCVSVYSNRKCTTHDDCADIQNGMCSDDNVCVCELDHEQTDENTCLPLLGQYCDKQTKCMTDNAICSYNTCACDTLFTQQSINRCLPTYLKQPCKLQDDCRQIKYAECSKDNKCVCRSNYIELNAVTCAPFLGGYCESDEECFVNQTKCIDNKCAHAPNVRPRTIEQHPPSSTRKCQDDKDCLVVKNTKCLANGECGCKLNHISVNQTLCLPLLNEDCSNSTCIVDNSYCIEDQCQCADHFVQHLNDKCLPTWLNEPCKIDADCKEIKNAVCSKKKTCVCKKSFNQFSLTRCTSLTEEFCTSNKDCPVENSACTNNFCECKPGFEQFYNNQCIPQMAMSSCSDDLECGEPWHGECSNEKKCSCKENSVAINISTCYPLLKGLCWRDEQCVTKNSVCLDYHCFCEVGYIPVANNLCVRVNL